MACYGLYDIELWHRGRAVPNLELMKIYNYYYQKGDKVIMMKPGEDEGRFSQIIYFKDNANTQIPRNLILTGKNKEIYGYGFFKYFIPLSEEFTEVPPSYLPYDAYTEKLSIKNYEAMKRDSYIRVENNDFTGYKQNRTNIYIADHNLCYLNNADEFLQEYKNHRFKLIHRAEFQDEETFRKFFRYASLIDRRFYINFDFNEDFFKEFFKERIVFDWILKDSKEIKKKILMIIAFKIENKQFEIKSLPNDNSLYNDILLWGRAFTQESCYEYYKNNKEVIKKIETAPSNIRTLLKYNPKKMKISDIDFKEAL